MRVMVVDDDPWLTDLLRRLVLNKRPGASVDCFGDVQTAYAGWQSNKYHLVLSDWNLPDDTGLSLIVQDTGPGMDAQMQSQLFKPFVRGDGSSTRRAGGTGLGLSICKRLVDMMEGRIIVDSTPGLGSRFEVRLPLALLPEPAPQVPPPAEATRWETHGLDGARVLVAEDHRVNQLLLEQLLLSVGVRITMVNNGVEAVDAVKRAGQGAFDLLLCDIEMPLMDGYQATEAILQMDPGLPVLGLTAHAFEEARAKGLRAGMVDYLVKPFVHDELMRLMARHARRAA